MEDNKDILFDVQILQTPALYRGMGQYVIALLSALHNELYSASPSTSHRVKLIVSSSNFKNSAFIKRLGSQFPRFEIVKLPLVDMSIEKDTSTATSSNKATLNDWIESENLQNSYFVIGSIFQTEIYPVFPDATKDIAIAYDVIPLQLFEQYKNKIRWEDYLQRFGHIYNAAKILCISKTVADDMQIYANVQPDKLTVIDGGPGLHKKLTRPKVAPKRKFILMPTGNDIRKNNHNAIIGFELFRQSHHEYELLITSHFSNEEVKELSKLSPNLVFTGSVTNSEMAWYYKRCTALLFPSYYEGLGMPLIEAAKFSKPIVASHLDAFLEISTDIPYYFNPKNSADISNALKRMVNDENFKTRLALYPEAVNYYTWRNSAIKLIASLNEIDYKKPPAGKPKIAIVGPHPNGASAIGKFMGIMHPYFNDYFDLEYFFESSNVDQELRPDILSYVTRCHHISALTDRVIKNFDLVIYHIGNSNHHTLTAARALLHPGIVILHDLNLENIFKDMVHRRLIDQGRYELEQHLDKNNQAKFITSLISRQRGVINHSQYAKSATEISIALKPPPIIREANLCVATPFNHKPIRDKKVFTIGLAGILANIKGLGVIEEIAKDIEHKHDRILIFGLNFAEAGILERLKMLSNVEIATDLTDYQFQENLKRMSVFVNYRTHYQGEASYSTLESMRYGVPVIVRGDLGWYSELPDTAVVKVSGIGKLKEEVKKLKHDEVYFDQVSKAAQEATRNIYNPKKYAKTAVNLAESILGRAIK